MTFTRAYDVCHGAIQNQRIEYRVQNKSDLFCSYMNDVVVHSVQTNYKAKSS